MTREQKTNNIEWLLESTDYFGLTGRKTIHDEKKLARMCGLLSLISDPQKSFKNIHVAGTKGKGSVAVMTASVLSAHGVKQVATLRHMLRR